MSVRHNIRHAVAFWDQHAEDGFFKKVAGCGCGWRVEGPDFDAIAEDVGFHTIAPTEDDGTAAGAQAAHDEAKAALYAGELAGDGP